MAGLGVAAAVAALALPALVAGGRSSVEQTVTTTGFPLYHQADLPSGEVTSFTVTCPPGYSAASGGVFTPAPGTIPLKSLPLPSGAGWSFRFINRVGNPAGKVTVVVFCLKAIKATIKFPPKKVVKVTFKAKPSTVKLGPVIVSPGDAKKLTLPCPTGQAPSGAGFDVAPSTGKRFLADSEPIPQGFQPSVFLTTIMPVPGAWNFTLVNVSGADQPAILSGTCLPRTYSKKFGKRRRSATFKIFRETVQDTVPPGEARFAHRCSANRLAIGSGFSSESTLVFSDGTGAGGADGARFAFYNASGQPQTEAEHFLCIARSISR
jgi:hypothetical protein